MSLHPITNTPNRYIIGLMALSTIFMVVMLVLSVLALI